MIGYLDKAIKPLVLIIPKMSGYVKRFKVKDKKIDWFIGSSHQKNTIKCS